ncbi:alkyl sulfatase C-terminal domain-containing protein [Streptomyces sp. col6]|uniref:alkyl sulfatase C-terminal domain-containing protein n=1 Tax=Streptomyces sp. col6 TaxID=2478958 RepID=UPI0021E3B9E2|nr:alkyl sulfatase C-terminal domain-containing protein [Streptomyces sp. col6]
MDVVVTDTGQRNRLRLANGALTYSSAPQRDQADVTLTTTVRALPALAAHGLAHDALAKSGIDVTGDPSVLSRLANLLDPGTRTSPSPLSGAEQRVADESTAAGGSALRRRFGLSQGAPASVVNPVRRRRRTAAPGPAGVLDRCGTPARP